MGFGANFPSGIAASSLKPRGHALLSAFAALGRIGPAEDLIPLQVLPTAPF